MKHSKLIMIGIIAKIIILSCLTLVVYTQTRNNKAKPNDLFKLDVELFEMLVRHDELCSIHLNCEDEERKNIHQQFLDSKERLLNR